MDIFRRALRRWRRDGIGAAVMAALAVASDRWFDLRYGVDTAGFVPPESLQTASLNRAHANEYGPTRVRPLRAFLAASNLPRENTFVDFGCGKGRVLLIAALHGFRAVVGVEFATDLCAVARANVETFRRKTQTNANIRVVEADAAAYAIPDDARTFFLFNPFRPALLRAVLDNIRTSLARAPRSVFVVYHNPVHREVIDNDPNFMPLEETAFGAYRFLVCGNRAPGEKHAASRETVC